MTRDRDDDLFDTGTLQFEFDGDEPDEPISETVELSRSALRAPESPRRVPASRFVVLIVSAVALGAGAFAIVDAVRGDGSTAAGEPQATQTAPSAAPAEPAEGAPATTAAPPATTAAAPAAEPPLVPVAVNAEGEDVRRLQEALAALGFSASMADGIYGQETTAAVAAFQASVGLIADGIAGPETITALNEALGRG